MQQPAIAIPAAEHSPILAIHINPLYNHYHYLVKQSNLPPFECYPAFVDAAFLMQQARNNFGVHGIWDILEQPLASNSTFSSAMRGLKVTADEIVGFVEKALDLTLQPYMEFIWPGHQEQINQALQCLQEQFVPQFPAMAQAQSVQLSVTWPEQVDAYLVAESYESRGGYSHPLTLDVTHVSGSQFCESLLHEATHVADVHTSISQKESLRDRLRASLSAAGVNFQRWFPIWHAFIFASSAAQIRRFINPEHVDYALTHNDLYTIFGVPNLPRLWTQFMTEADNEAGLLEAVIKEVQGA